MEKNYVSKYRFTFKIYGHIILVYSFYTSNNTYENLEKREVSFIIF